MTGTVEHHSIPVVRYRDAQGQPTCAIDFPGGKVCEFYRTQRFGFNETCLFAEGAAGARYTATMQRRTGKDRDGTGTLIPLATCPVWRDVPRVWPRYEEAP